MNPNTNPTHRDYIDRMWDDRGFGVNREADILTAHGMVQSFVNAFARDGVYKVHFDPNVQTAGTEYKTRRVVITPAPILDTDLTPVEAGRVLTGLAVHEISHPRFGKHTHNASRKVWPNSPTAHKLQNLLDDVRIERRFTDQYPGYAGVFRPTLDYVGRGTVARNGGRKITARLDDPLNLAVMAVRYPEFADFTGVEHELDWWTRWAARYTANDTAKLFVAGIRAALKHIAEMKDAAKQQPAKDTGGSQPKQPDAPQEQQPEESSQTGADEDQKEASSSDEDDTSTDQDASSDGQQDEDGSIDAEGADTSPDASQEADTEDGEEGADGRSDDDIARDADEAADPLNVNPKEQMPACAGKQAVEQAARNNGVTRDEIQDAKAEAEEIIEAAEYYEDDGLGGRIDVARSMRGLQRSSYGASRSDFRRSDAAARAIREAIARSRTGHTDVATYQKRGRIDNRGLHRIAQQDARIFERKSAASPGKFLIWMMLDRSSSMDGVESVQSAQVATAIADATRHLPTVRAAVWAWSNSFRGSYGYGGSAGVALAWKTGQDTSEIAKTVDLRSGGTPDAEVLSWAWRAIRKEAKSGEQPVILMCSDGFGSNGMDQIVADARAHGVIVKSVAIGQIRAEDQERRYGPDGYIPWMGSILATAKPLARMIAKMVGRDARQRGAR